MKTGQPNNYSYQSQRGGISQRQQGMQHDGDYFTLADITLGMILQKLWQGILYIWVALKYQFHRLTGGIFMRMRWSWYKLAVAVLLIFILTKKDIQFSINMRAPGTSPATEEAGGAQPVSLKSSRFDLVPSFLFGNSKKESSLEEIEPAAIKQYVQRFRKVAQIEMQKFGIPASIKMAQGILESQAGQASPAAAQHNHFSWRLGEQTYESAWESWRAHSILIRNEYPDLFDEAGSNYRKWAKGLQKAGYSKNSGYADQLLEIIDTYQLYMLDEQ